ncbi:MAG: SOS response-associated peptidase family protein, partial [Gammaproteobacteria bacterium]
DPAREAGIPVALRSRQCLVPTSGFYEWKTKAGRKHPYSLTGEDKQQAAFAGLWDEWDVRHPACTRREQAIRPMQASESSRPVTAPLVRGACCVRRPRRRSVAGASWILCNIRDTELCLIIQRGLMSPSSLRLGTR